MTERHSYKELWVVAGILLAVVLVTQLPGVSRAADGANGERLVAMMGASRRVIAPAETFRGADVTVVMGNCRLDLREAAVQPGDEMVIDLLTVMGSVVLRVPEGWVVDTSAIPVVGGIKDTRMLSQTTPPLDGKPAPRLVLHGAVLFGGIRITS